MKCCGVIVQCLFAGSLLAQVSPAQTSSGQPTPNPTPTAGAAKIDAAKEADIRRLMDLAGTAALVSQMMSGTENNIKPLMTSSLPPGDYREKVIELFFEKFHANADPHQILDMAVPSYDKYYTHEEIKGLIRFYETPLGQKMIAVLPKMMGELQLAGQKWGEALGRDCMNEVLTEHPDLAEALNDAAKNAQPR
jgi:hypothetical protein